MFLGFWSWTPHSVCWNASQHGKSACGDIRVPSAPMLVPAGWVREVLPVPGPVAGDRAPPTRCPPLPSDVSLSGSFPLLGSGGSLRLFFVPCTKGSQRRRVPVSAAGSPDKGRSRRGSASPPRSPRRAPAHISVPGDELCMAHRSGRDCSYSLRGLRLW